MWIDNGQCQDIPRKKRPRDVDNEPSDVSQASPVPSRNTVGMRRASTNVSSYVQQQQPPNFSLPMYSNELGRLPIYGQFQFSDTVPCIPVQPSDDFVNLISDATDTLYNPYAGAYATHPSFEGQMMGNLVNHNQGTSSDFAGFSPGDTYNLDVLSSFGDTPAMDNATMAAWSAAPTNLECVSSLSVGILSDGLC